MFGREFLLKILSLMIIVITFASGCAQWNPGTGLDRLKRWTEPSNDRDWRPEFAKTSTITRQNQVLSIRNIRNCNYLSSDDFVVDYYDRQFTVDQIQTVDFIVVPFQNAPRLAHTMMSFGLDDSSYIAVSVEVRKEVGESYSAIKGIGRQYELMYVVSDERDVIRLRTRHRDADVYVYPTIANPIQAQELFLNIAERVNKLAVDPEFYNTITNNCTTNLAGHVNEVSPNKIKYGWKVLLPGLSAKYAYDLGLLDTRIPFEDLKTLSHVNDLAEEHFDDPQFSQLIRSNHSRLERYLARQALREPTLNARGQLFLNTISKKR